MVRERRQLRARSTTAGCHCADRAAADRTAVAQPDSCRASTAARNGLHDLRHLDRPFPYLSSVGQLLPHHRRALRQKRRLPRGVRHSTERLHQRSRGLKHSRASVDNVVAHHMRTGVTVCDPTVRAASAEPQSVRGFSCCSCAKSNAAPAARCGSCGISTHRTDATLEIGVDLVDVNCG